MHAERHFVLGNAGLNFRIDPLLGEHPVEAVDFFDDLPLRALANAFRVANIVNGVAFRLEQHALKTTRQKSVRPLPRRNRLLPGLARGGEHDKARQIVRLRADAVKQP